MQSGHAGITLLAASASVGLIYLFYWGYAVGCGTREVFYYVTIDVIVSLFILTTSTNAILRNGSKNLGYLRRHIVLTWIAAVVSLTPIGLIFLKGKRVVPVLHWSIVAWSAITVVILLLKMQLFRSQVVAIGKAGSSEQPKQPEKEGTNASNSTNNRPPSENPHIPPPPYASCSKTSELKSEETASSSNTALANTSQQPKQEGSYVTINFNPSVVVHTK